MNELPVVRRAGGCAAWVAIEPELGVVVRLALSWLPRNCALNDNGTVGLRDCAPRVNGFDGAVALRDCSPNVNEPAGAEMPFCGAPSLNEFDAAGVMF